MEQFALISSGDGSVSEECEYDELRKRMWEDQMKIRSIKGLMNLAGLECGDKQEHKQPSDGAQRKRMSRAQDDILKYMIKLVDACKIRDFVYRTITEKGKPIGGASENMRSWWKEKVEFDKNGPAALAKHGLETVSFPFYFGDVSHWTAAYDWNHQACLRTQGSYSVPRVHIKSKALLIVIRSSEHVDMIQTVQLSVRATKSQCKRIESL
ncbi:hypothetical protein ACLOJK_017384 [Asimina triloba]